MIKKPSGISKYLIAPVFIGLAFAGISGWIKASARSEELKNDKSEEEAIYLQEADELIERVYRKVAGEDGFLDAKEKRNLLYKLGIKTVLDENEVVSLVSREGGIEVYFISGGQYNRNLGG